MSTLRDRQHRHDHYYSRAKREDYVARSVYKLMEIDKKFGLLAPMPSGPEQMIRFRRSSSLRVLL